MNLTWNTALPLPGALAAPVTALWGPTAADNAVLWAGLVASMLAMRWCAGAVTRRTGTAWLAGLVYGCSPYLVAQAFGHLNLALVMVPPLIARVLLELYTGRTGWRRAGLLLAGLSVVQWLVTEEVLVSSVVTAAAATAVLALRHRRTLTRQRVRDVAAALALGAGVALTVLAVPLAVQLRGPGALSGPATEPVSFVADLLGIVVPNRNQLLHGSWTTTWAAGFSGNATENGSFLGPAAVALVLWSAWRFRGRTLDWTLVAVVAWVLSLGGNLRVAGSATPVRLPFRLIWELPLLGSLIPARFSLYVLLAAVLAAAAASDAWSLPRSVAGRLGTALLALAVAVPLLPAWPMPYAPVSVPPWAATPRGYGELPRGAVVQTWPLSRRHTGSPRTSSPVDWQAQAGFWYRTTGGHAITRGPDGRGAQDGGVGPWETASRLAAARCTGAVPLLLREQVREEWARLGVEAVVLDPTAAGAARVRALLTALTGRGPDSARLGVELWRVRQVGQALPHLPDC